MNNGYSCTCAPGFTGIHCETGKTVIFSKLITVDRQPVHTQMTLILTYWMAYSQVIGISKMIADIESFINQRFELGMGH